MPEEYDLLIMCYKSDQIPEAEWQELVKDEELKNKYFESIR